MEERDYALLSPEEKRVELYLQQKQLLEEFLSHGAITEAQFQKSFHDLTEKMGMGAYAGNKE